MKRILVVSFEDLDVSEGLAELIHDNPGAPVVIPVTDGLNFVKSAVDTAMNHDCVIQLFFSQANEFTDALLLSAEDLTVCDNPIKTMLREVTPEDILAISWDDSLEAHQALHSVEDYGLETWDISDGLTPIELEHETSDDLYAEMQESLTNFIEVFAAYITAGVVEAVAKTIDQVVSETILGDTPYDFDDDK